jgi:uncharacterized membrane protein SirB2
MIEFYPQIKSVHVVMVLLSVSLFALRGAAALAGRQWPMSWPLRWTSYAIDTTLLTAALMLLAILPWGLFANGWLAVKLGLLVIYIVLAFMALRPGRPRQARVVLYVIALLVYGWMYTIARSHHPFGIFRGLAS